jgi:hypothetical protein
MKIPSAVLLLTCVCTADLPAQRTAVGGEPVVTLRQIASVDGSGPATSELSRVRHMVGLSGGRVAVVDAGWPGIRIFDTTGTFVSRFSGAGSGPGEYRSVTTLGAHGDSVWLLDINLKRTTIFAPDGRPAVTHPWSKLIESPQKDGTISPRGLFTDRTHWGWSEGMALADSAPRPVRKLARLALDAQSLASLGSLPAGADWFVIAKPGGGFVLGKQPFANQPLAFTSARSARFTIIERATRDGSNGKVRVTARSSTGQTLWERELSVDARPIPKRITDSVWTRQLKGVRDVPGGERQLRERLYLPATYPPVRSAFLTQDDELWMQLDQRAGTDQWVVIARDGRLTGRVQVPTGVTLQAGSGNVVWGTRVDADDIPELIAYQVSRTR